jgi:hypothetical protein
VLVAESLLCIWVGSWIGRHHRVRHFANAVAAGVFLGSGLIHVLPHAADLLAPGAETQAHGHEERFPLASALVLAMFYIMLLADTLVPRKWSHVGHEDVLDAHGAEVGPSNRAAERPASSDRVLQAGTAAAGTPAPATLHSSVDDDLETTECDCVDCDIEAGALSPDETGSGSSKEADDDDAASLSLDKLAARFLSPAFTKGSLFLVGVSFHSVLEAVSFGLAPGFDGALSIFIAIAAHRAIFASAFLARLISLGSLSRLQISILFGSFVAMMPIGASIGAGLSSLPGKVEGVFVALAAGSFLYLGAFEGFAMEFVEHTKWKREKFAAALSGSAIMVIIEGILVKTGNTV